MDKVLNIVANETNGKCYTSFRYCADDEIRVPTLDFDSKEKEISVVVKEFGESDTLLNTSKSLKPLAWIFRSNSPLKLY